MEALVDVFSVLAFILTIIAVLFINITGYIFYKHRNVSIIRFRWPLSYIIWCILCDIYFISRICYVCGAVYKFYDYTESVSIVLFCIRGIGLNGSYMVLLCRIWLYYYTYAYDHAVLNFDDHNTSFIVKYKNKLGNQTYVLCVMASIFGILSLIFILERTLLNDQINHFTEVYFGFSFLLFVLLAFLIPKKHDQLGLFTETVFYFIAAFIAFIVLLIVEFTLEEDRKRVMLWFGATVLLLIINSIAFYIVIIRYDGYKYILKDNEVMILNSRELNQNYMELAKIISSERTYKPFRNYLANIFCVENLDFFTITQHFRLYVVENINQSRSRSNSNEMSDQKQHEKNVSNMDGAIRRKRTQDQIVASILSKNNKGKNMIDITKLDVNFVDLPMCVKELNTTKDWIEWIYNHYVDKNAEWCLNLPSKMRKFYAVEYEKLMKQSENNKDDVEMQSSDNIFEISRFYDKAQYEIWKLMAQDSMVHFRNSDIYSQIMWHQDK